MGQYEDKKERKVIQIWTDKWISWDTELSTNNYVDYTPDDYNDAVKDVIGVSQVVKEAKSRQL